jgi:hypothetical protein
MFRIFKDAAFKDKRKTDHQFWTHENHAEHIYSPKFIEHKLNYIHQNPVRAGIVLIENDYIYSSAINYSGGKGVLDVSLLMLRWKTVN